MARIDEAAVVAGWVAGETDPQIAARLGCGRNGVGDVRKRLGLPAVPRSEPTADEVEQTIREQLAKGKPDWWQTENRRSVIFELYAAGLPY